MLSTFTRTSLLSSLVVTITLMMTTGCPPPPSTPHASLSLSLPGDAVAFGTSIDAQTITVGNAGGGEGRGLRWRIASEPDWALLTPAEGSLLPGEEEQITLTLRGADLRPGENRGKAVMFWRGDVTIVRVGESKSNNGLLKTERRVEIPITAVGPSLAVSPDDVSFGTATDTARDITIRNDAGGILTWSASANADWLSLGPASGTLEPGAERTVTLTVAQHRLSAGTNQANVNITSNAGNASVDVSAEGAALQVSPASLNFDDAFRSPTRTITVSNTGGGSLSWSTSIPAPASDWLSVSPAGGSVPGSKATVTVHVDHEKMNFGDNHGSIIFSGGGQQVTSSVTARRVVAFDLQEYWPFAVGNNWKYVDVFGDNLILTVTQRIEKTGTDGNVYDVWQLNVLESAMAPPPGQTAYAVYVGGALFVSDQFGLDAGDFDQLPSTVNLFPWENNPVRLTSTLSVFWSDPFVGLGVPVRFNRGDLFSFLPIVLPGGSYGQGSFPQNYPDCLAVEVDVSALGLPGPLFADIYARGVGPVVLFDKFSLFFGFMGGLYRLEETTLKSPLTGQYITTIYDAETGEKSVSIHDEPPYATLD